MEKGPSPPATDWVIGTPFEGCVVVDDDACECDVELVTDDCSPGGALESGNRQNLQKPDEKHEDSLVDQPTKPTKPTFGAFVGNPLQERASFPPSPVKTDRIRAYRQKYHPAMAWAMMAWAIKARNCAPVVAVPTSSVTVLAIWRSVMGLGF